jgi:aminoglycoside N3'-acetyltransferase
VTLRNWVRDALRRVLGTRDIGNTLRKRRLALKKRIWRKPVSLADTREMLRSLGVTRGRVVWVQSSWNEFYNLTAKPTDVLGLLCDLVGPEGTLVMPAFPVDQDPEKVLQIDMAPSSSGLLTELFRRQKGVLRSIHLSSSVCALGPAADFLVRDHHKDIFAWGLQTPFCRLREVDARLVCLGLGRFVTNLTPLHAVECLLYDEVPYYRTVFDGTLRYRWRRRTGEEGEHEFRRRIGQLALRRYGRHFPPDSYINVELSNLRSFAIDARTAIDHAVELGRRGITMYAVPKPRPELFVGAVNDQ